MYGQQNVIIESGVTCRALIHKATLEGCALASSVSLGIAALGLAVGRQHSRCTSVRLTKLVATVNGACCVWYATHPRASGTVRCPMKRMSVGRGLHLTNSGSRPLNAGTVSSCTTCRNSSTVFTNAVWRAPGTPASSYWPRLGPPTPESSLTMRDAAAKERSRCAWMGHRVCVEC